MMRVRRPSLALALGLVLMLGSPSEADDLLQAKQALVAAAKAGDLAAARSAARNFDGDPWYVVDALIADGELPAARLYCEVVEDAERDSLRKAVESAPPEDTAARTALRRAKEHGAGGDYSESVAALSSADPPVGSILRARFYIWKALSTLRLKNKAAARVAFEHAVAAAQHLGWRRLEAQSRRGVLACMKFGEEPAIQTPHLLRLHELREFVRNKTLLAKFEHWLGGHLDTLGQTGAAGMHLALASELYEGSGERVGAAQAAGNAALAKARSGDYAGALDWLRRAASHWQGNEGRAGYAYYLVQAGAVHTEVGNTTEARDLLRRAEQGVSDGADAADALGQIGLLALVTGDPDAAATAIGRALRIYQRLESKTDIGRAHRMMGKIAYQRRQYDQAVLEFKASLQLAEGDLWSAMQARVGLGRSWAAQKKFKPALQALRVAAAEAEEASAREVQFEALVGLADVYLQQRKPKKARELAVQAIDLLERIAEGLSDEPMARVRARRSEPFSIALRASLALGDGSAGVHALERWRARALLDALGGRQALREATLPREVAEAEALAARRWAAAIRRIERARHVGRDRREVRRLVIEVNTAERHYLEATRASRRAAKRIAAITHPVPRDGKAIQKDLAKNEALVLFAVYGDRIGAYVLTKGASAKKAPEARWVDLGGRKEAEDRCLALVLAWSKKPQDVESDDAPAGTGLKKRDAKPVPGEDDLAWIRKHLVAKLRLPSTAKRVFIVPDGQLSYVPWSVVLKGKDVACVPSGTVLSLLRAEPRVASARIFALGDPVYKRDGVPVHPRTRGRFGRLEGSGVEAENAAPGKHDRLLLREDATESKVRAAFADEGGYAAAQFGCHGIVPSNSPAFSALVLTPEGTDDGFLTLIEVLGMRIRANLVTLSACDLGHGAFIPGEGVLGLPRAFMVAGVPRALVGLWQVNDKATAVLMTEFYKQWKAGTSTPEALRRAQKLVKSTKGWSHPKYWAAWVLWGLPD